MPCCRRPPSSSDADEAAARAWAPAYALHRRLGEGASGAVWLASAPEGPQRLVALKSADLATATSWQLDTACREATALARLPQHVGLVKPLQLELRAGRYLGLALRFSAGGTLESYVRSRRPLSEDEARFLFTQLLQVVSHLHRNRLGHRDLKLANVLLDRKPGALGAGPPPRLVLCDLGCATSSPVSSTFMGTPGFMGPQQLASMFNIAATAASGDDSSVRTSTSRSSLYDAAKADVWGLGALLHYLLFKQLPHGYDAFALLLPPAEALMTLYSLETGRSWQDSAGRRLRHISSEARDLLDRLMHPEESERISLAGIKAHPFLQQPLPPRFSSALAQLAAEQAALDAVASSAARRDCRRLAAGTVDQLFQLLRSPAALAQLQRQRRSLAVPLSSFGLAAPSLPEAQRLLLVRRQLLQVQAEIEREAALAGITLVNRAEALAMHSCRPGPPSPPRKPASPPSAAAAAAGAGPGAHAPGDAPAGSSPASTPEACAAPAGAPATAAVEGAA